MSYSVNRDTKQSLFENVSGSGVVLATDDYHTTPKTLVDNSGSVHSKDTIYVQRITIGVTTDNAATQTFEDSASTPLKLLTTKASPGLGPIDINFGEEGFALTEGKDFQLINSAAGLAYSYTYKAYRRRTGAGVPNP